MQKSTFNIVITDFSIWFKQGTNKYITSTCPAQNGV